MQPRTRILAVVAAAAVVVLAVVVLAHDAVASFGLRTAVATFGYDLHAQRTRLGLSELSLIAPDVRNRAGEPVFTAQRVDVRFSLRDFLPGSKARFGLHAIDLERPVLTLIHHADATYNVALPGGNGPPARPDTTPLDVRLRVRDGRVVLIDRFVVPNHERRESLTGVQADAILAPTDPAYYRVDATLEDGARRYPIAGRARFDHQRGFASQHWYAPELPVGPLANFAIATHAIHIVDGRLRGVEARLYGFIHPDGSTDTHVGAAAQLVDGKIFTNQLRVPIGDAHGPFRIYDDGVTTTGIDATLARVPVKLVGGIYGLSHPALRFLISGRGPLERLRTISNQSVSRPLSGDVAFALRADGPIDKPIVRGAFASPKIAYQHYVLRDAAGSIAFEGTRFDVLGVGARYGGLAVSAGGALLLEQHVGTNLVALVNGPAEALPYAAAILPHDAVHAIVHLSGTDEQLAADGYVAARGARGSLDAPFALAPGGVGAIGPIALARSDGASLYGRVDVDRPHNLVDAIVTAHRLSLVGGAARPDLPGFPTASLPSLAGMLDADVVAELHGSNVAAASGDVHVRRAGFAGLPIGDADAHLGARGSEVALEDVTVHGPLAQLRGYGSYANGLFAGEGRVHSSFDRLGALLHGVAAHGTIDAPVRFVANLNGSRTLLQVDDARFGAAQIAGVPVRSASVTVALRGRAYDIPAARLDAAGGTVVAGGSFGNGGTVNVSANGIDTGALRAAGVPMNAGRLDAVAAVTGTLDAPRAQAGLALAGAQYAGHPFDAAATGTYDDGRVTIDGAGAAYAGAVASATGTIAGLQPGAIHPRLDVDAHVRGADVGTFAHALGVALPYPDAAVDADMRVRGSASDPAIAGDARIPAGSINGLAFHDVVVPLSGGLNAVDVRAGRATVGSTTLHFDAVASRGGARGNVRSDSADLADFNDYFDSADTLAGKGRLAVGFALSPSSLATSGDVALADTRYRRLPIGDVNARWSTQGRTIAATASVGGAHGRLSARGSAVVPAGDPLAQIRSSYVNGRATIAGLDLTTWLPAAGIAAPVTGRLDGDVQFRGNLPRVALAGNASLVDGNVGRIPIRTATVSAAMNRGRTQVTAARVEALNLVAQGSGSFGLGPRDPIDLSLRATSPDIVAFANHATGKSYDGAAALDTTLTVRGTRPAPAIEDVADLSGIRYRQVAAKDAHADVAFDRNRLTLRQLALDLTAGRLAVSGSVPATLAPPFIDARNAPVALHLVAQGVDVGQFSKLFPKDTKLGGIVDADVGVAGTTGDPELLGTLAFNKGTYVSQMLASEVRNAALRLSFAGHNATLTALHADMGGGAIDGTGVATLTDLRNPAQSLAFRLDTRVKNVGIDMPKYMRGKVNGAVAITRGGNAPVTIGGNLDFSHARIPLNALLPAKGGTTGAAPLPVAFNLAITASRDDRLQGPFVDVGAQGNATLTGTLADPALDGAFSSTDGTISFYRTFVLQQATVAFDPSSGIVPDVNVTATTHVPDPSTNVLLTATGPATSLTLNFASDPNYDRAQIIGLLVGAQNLGAVSGVAMGERSPAAPDASAMVQNAALGYIDSRFTQSIFEPFSSSIGKALGLSTFSFNADLTGGYSASATRALSRNLQAEFSEESGQEGQRQSFGLAWNFGDAAAAQFTLFGAGSQPRTLGTQTPFTNTTGPVNYTLQSLAPPPGSSGYVFTYVRKFP